MDKPVMKFAQPTLKCGQCDKRVACGFARVSGNDAGPVIPPGWFISGGAMDFVAVCSEACAKVFAEHRGKEAVVRKVVA